jgi:murein DD-endopeptidase MepM/ murein hydrolase activator NlpD
VPLRSRRGRHRRQRKIVPMPTAVGTLAIVAAASGALTLSHSTGLALASEGAVAPVPALDEALSGLGSGLGMSVSASGSSGAAMAGGAATTLGASGGPMSVSRVVSPVAEVSLAEAELAAAAERDRVRAVLAARKAAAERAARAQKRAEAAAAKAAAARAQRLARAYSVPTEDFRITAGFGSAGRMWSNLHTGLDFAAPNGTPVYAVQSGTIAEAGYAGAYGNRIVLRADDGTVTWYCHLSAITVSSGRVTSGQRIGAVGATGNVTGSHLHFEVRPGGGDPVDPMSWLRAKGVGL